MSRAIIGGDDYILVYVNTPFEVCEKRDVKGLYRKARMGLIPMFTGLDSPYEPPEKPDIEIRTDLVTVEQGVETILKYVLPKVEYSK